MPHVLITGGLGFIGRQISSFFLDRGFYVTATGTRTDPEMIDHPAFDYIAADTRKEGKWQKIAEQVDAVVNLAGSSIFQLWTEKRKDQIYDSRILTTRNLVNALARGRAKVLCSTSAVGYYGDGGEEILTEEHPPGKDFLARLGTDWEKEAMNASKHGVRVSIMRFGIVLDKSGGAMSKMLPAFKMFVGGPLGTGRQWFSWIHLHDLLNAVGSAVMEDKYSGTYNLCSPNPVRQRVFAEKVGKHLHRPVLMPAVPVSLMKLILGEFGEAIIKSQRAIPKRLERHGFQFQYPDLDRALDQIVGST